jgi:predicted AAA+ superfamily ATPase
MSQSKVTGYFANRKRTRFNQQDMLAKNKQAQIKTPPPKAVKVILKAVENEKMTRSKQITKVEQETTIKLIVDDGENETPKTRPLTRRSSARLSSADTSLSTSQQQKKEKLAEIKERRAALDDKVRTLKNSRSERADKRTAKQKIETPDQIETQKVEDKPQQIETKPTKIKVSSKYRLRTTILNYIKLIFV